MTKRLTTILVSLAAMMALTAVVVGNASAAEFKHCKNVGAGNGEFENANCEGVAGTKTFKSETVKEALGGSSPSGVRESVTSTLTGTIGTTKVKIVCGKIFTVFVLDPEAGHTKFIDLYEECTVPEPTGNVCSVSYVEAMGLDFLVYEVGSGKVFDLFTPVTPTTVFAEVNLTGASCAPKGKQPVKGSVLGTVSPENKFATTGKVNFKVVGGVQTPNMYNEKKNEPTGTEAKLTFGGNAATYESENKLELLSKEQWGAFM